MYNDVLIYSSHTNTRNAYFYLPRNDVKVKVFTIKDYVIYMAKVYSYTHITWLNFFATYYMMRNIKKDILQIYAKEFE